MRLSVFSSLSAAILWCFGPQNCIAQQDDYIEPDSTIAMTYQGQSSVYGEFGGSALRWSVNYDRVLKALNYRLLTGRVGLQLEPGTNSTLAIPAEVSWLLGDYKNFIEITGGMTYFDYRESELEQSTRSNYLAAITRAGYRFQKPHGSIFFRLSVVLGYPLLVWKSAPDVDYNKPFIGAGLGLGWSFKTKTAVHPDNW